MNKFVAQLFFVVLANLAANAFASPLSSIRSVTMKPTTTERPIIYDPKEMVKIELKLLNKTECHRDYSVEITNYVFFLVCDLKIQVELPESTTLENVINLKLVNGTTDQFIFPESVRYLYVSKTLNAQLIVSIKGDGGEPKVSVLDAKAAYMPNKCKTSKF